MLKSVALNGGKVVATEELHTAGKPDHILLTSSRKSLTSNWDDLAYVTATVVDAHNIVVPDAAHLITFKASGPTSVIAVDSSDVTSHEPFQATQRTVYEGRCVAILRGGSQPGHAVLTASSPGLASANLSIYSLGNTALATH